MSRLIFRFADGRAKPIPDDMEAAYLVYGYMEKMCSNHSHLTLCFLGNFACFFVAW